MNFNQVLDMHLDFSMVNLNDLIKAETRIFFVLYYLESEYGIDELTTSELLEFINSKLRLKTTRGAINNAISRSKGKISSINKGETIVHKIMTPGINEIKEILNTPIEKKVLDLIIPDEVVVSEKDYFLKVVRQINGCYQDYYFDACFVMIRRAVETLIIEVYESHNKENLILSTDGNYLPFSKLIDKTLSDNVIKLSKIAKQDLKKIKKLGDTAAHNRKINLKKSDLDTFTTSIRMIVEELINNKV